MPGSSKALPPTRPATTNSIVNASFGSFADVEDGPP